MKYSFSFELTRKDYGDYAINYYQKTKLRGFIFSLLVCAAIILFWLNKKQNFNLGAGIIAASAGLGVMLLMTWLQLRNSGKSFKENGPVLCYKTVEFMEEGIHYSDWYTTSTTKWQAVSRVLSSRKGVYIFLNGPMAFIIPDRAFQNDQEKTSFIAFVNGMITSVASSANSGKEQSPASSNRI